MHPCWGLIFKDGTTMLLVFDLERCEPIINQAWTAFVKNTKDLFFWWWATICLGAGKVHFSFVLFYKTVCSVKWVGGFCITALLTCLLTHLFLLACTFLKPRNELRGPDIFHVGGNTPEVDMAILASCNASIICRFCSNCLKYQNSPKYPELVAYGTFGLWGAILSGGETIVSRRTFRF